MHICTKKTQIKMIHVYACMHDITAEIKMSLCSEIWYISNFRQQINIDQGLLSTQLNNTIVVCLPQDGLLYDTMFVIRLIESQCHDLVVDWHLTLR